MKNATICGFYPTDHCIYRCWERGISRDTLCKVLRRVKRLNGFYTILVPHRELIKIGCNPPPTAQGSPLCIIVENRRLQTAYWLCEAEKRINVYRHLVQVI